MGSPFGELECIRVSSDKDREDFDRLWQRQYQASLNLPAPPGPPEPYGPQHLALLARTGDGTPVGTMLCQSPGYAPDEPVLPYEADQVYAITPWLTKAGLPRSRVAEIRRVTACDSHKGVLQALVAMALGSSEQAGVTFWLGLLDACTNRFSDGVILHRALEAHGLMSLDLPLAPLQPNALWTEATARADVPSAFTPEQLRRLPLPRKLRSFCQTFSARVIAPPTEHPHFRRTVVPVLAEIATFKSTWTKKG